MSVADGTALRIVAQWLMPDSVIAQNIFYALFNDTGGSNDDQDVADDCADWIDDMFGDLISVISNDMLVQLAHVYKRDTIDDDWDEVGTSLPTVVFTDVDTIVPHGVAALIHGFTVDPDVRGSKFIPGWADAEQTESNISGGGLAALVTFGADWVTGFVGGATGGDFDPGVWSVAQNAFFQFADHIVANGNVAYQRRRKPGVGI